MWLRRDTQTDTLTRVTTTRFASSTTHVKCNKVSVPAVLVKVTQNLAFLFYPWSKTLAVIIAATHAGTAKLSWPEWLGQLLRWHITQNTRSTAQNHILINQ